MLEKLDGIEKKYEALENSLSDPAIVGDMEKYKAAMKERKSLEDVVTKYREYKAAARNFAEAEELSKISDDPDMKELALEEYAESKAAMERIEGELKVLLLPKDPDDDKNVIIEIRQGAGGEEAALFASVLYRMYTMYAEAAGFRSELVNANETELGGFKEVSFTVEGKGAFGRFKFESGVHRVQRVPETESQGRIHTSTATVAVLPEAEDLEFELNMDELEITRHHSAGAGGQHVNKTESAIRIIHIPTGIVVDCQDERSQMKNKDKALKIMRSRLYALEKRKKEESIASERHSQIGTGDRSERIRTYNYPQGRVTDHRIGMTLYSLDSFLDGKIDEMVDALIRADRAERLKAGEN